ncbi:hypothetical protein DF3PB_710007 [uncultured Defluviicoccus sp.]|uniref:Uncharacterized protein n=1 Tax=metagenome TaxID=256318 RepID=A0A380TJ97_9ZZZZ|nr:hypothetical protein DF3PB_710007 [uncultured Defluviicoccus sp.]
MRGQPTWDGLQHPLANSAGTKAAGDGGLEVLIAAHQTIRNVTTLGTLVVLWQHTLLQTEVVPELFCPRIQSQQHLRWVLLVPRA